MMDAIAFFDLDDRLIVLIACLGAAALIVAPFVILTAMRHKSRLELDHYGKFRGSGPAPSFVCPDCLTRTYAPSHIARRWCGRCEKSFAERKAANVEKLPRWLTDDLGLEVRTVP